MQSASAGQKDAALQAAITSSVSVIQAKYIAKFSDALIFQISYICTIPAKHVFMNAGSRLEFTMSVCLAKKRLKIPTPVYCL